MHASTQGDAGLSQKNVHPKGCPQHNRLPGNSCHFNTQIFYRALKANSLKKEREKVTAWFLYSFQG